MPERKLLSIDPALHHALKVLAAEQMLTIKELAGRVLKDHIKKHSPHLPGKTPCTGGEG